MSLRDLVNAPLLFVLLVGAPACSKSRDDGKARRASGSGSGGASVVPKLTTATVRALLYRCEARAQAADEKGFRGCLTAASAKRLDQQFRSVQMRLSRAALAADALRRRALALDAKKRDKVAPQLAALGAQRLRLAAMLTRVSWKAHLALIAKAPRSEVLALDQKGVHAKFKKRVGIKGKAKESWHTLAYERGQWRVDLVGNPDFARRVGGLESAVRRGLLVLRATQATLRVALDKLGAPKGGGKAAPVKAVPGKAVPGKAAPVKAVPGKAAGPKKTKAKTRAAKSAKSAKSAK